MFKRPLTLTAKMGGTTLNQIMKNSELCLKASKQAGLVVMTWRGTITRYLPICMSLLHCDTSKWNHTQCHTLLQWGPKYPKMTTILIAAISFTDPFWCKMPKHVSFHGSTRWMTHWKPLPGWRVKWLLLFKVEVTSADEWANLGGKLGSLTYTGWWFEPLWKILVNWDD